MERIVVVGTSGSGKTTLAQALSDKLGLAHIELDGIFHQPNWVPRPADEFQADLQAPDDRVGRPVGYVWQSQFGER